MRSVMASFGTPKSVDIGIWTYQKIGRKPALGNVKRRIKIFDQTSDYVQIPISTDFGVPVPLQLLV